MFSLLIIISAILKKDREYHFDLCNIVQIILQKQCSHQTVSVNRESSVWLMFIRRFQLCFSCVCQLFGSTFLVLHGAHTITLSKQLVEVGTIAEIQFCRDFRNTLLGIRKLFGCIFHSKTHAVIKKTLSGVFFDNPSEVRPIVIQDLRQFLVGDPAMPLIEELIFG